MHHNKTENIQGNINLTTITDRRMKENNRNGNESSMQQEVDYRSNFPKIFCIFDRPTSKFPTRKTNQTSGNHNNFPKKDQVQE